MPSLNKVICIGHLGNDAEMRFTPNGKAVTTFSVATSYPYQKEGEDTEWLTEWFNIVTWGDLAERCNQNFHKGLLVYCEGQQRTRKWEDNEGQTHYRTEVHAQKAISLERKPKEPEQESPTKTTAQETDLDDIPF